ncbi:MAG: HIT domain-containing protein [Deltaproteobacteria bacterium]|nr:MAG: HIT domain-containing protein [Deltaproteobacteria bacterium]
MDRLWAPWRMTYINGEDHQSRKGCIFCLGHEEEDRERLILFRGRAAFVIMNKYPYSNGHLMVAPYRHTADLGSLDLSEVEDVWRLTVLARDVLTEWGRPDGFNIGMNWGRVAGAGVEDHLHQHIVPRWHGDTNFMPVLADVRVIPQHLEETADLLRGLFDARNPYT